MPAAYREGVTRGDVATVPAGRAGAHAFSLTSPRAPYAVLASLQAVSAVLVGFFYAFPGGFAVARNLELWIGGALLLLALLTWFVVPRLRGTWWLDGCIVASGVVAATAVMGVPHGEGQLTIGLGLLALGMFAAYFRTSRHVLVDMVLCSALFLAATLVNPLLSTQFLACVFCVIIVGASYAFSVLVTALRDQALHDELTGLLNRHGLSLLAPPVVAGARRAEAGVTVCVIDVDRFKLFNDTFGHPAGDRLLGAVAESWQGAVRDSDLVVRWGGDEIVVLLIGTTNDAVDDLQARALAAFEARRPTQWTETWTCGLTALAAGEAVETAIARADAELIARKRSRLPDQRPAPDPDA